MQIVHRIPRGHSAEKINLFDRFPRASGQLNHSPRRCQGLLPYIRDRDLGSA